MWRNVLPSGAGKREGWRKALLGMQVAGRASTRDGKPFGAKRHGAEVSQRGRGSRVGGKRDASAAGIAPPMFQQTKLRVDVVLTRVAASVVKIGAIGGIAALIQMASAPLGLPIGSTWFDGFMVGYGLNVVIGSAVSSMVEPDETSSKAYIFIFRYGHAMFNRATTYYTHRSLWKTFVNRDEERKVNRGA
jgi:hypothetical protein